jgi:hypothetical protein
MWLCALLIAACLSVSAAPPDLSGTWELNREKSDYGQNYRAPQKQTNTIEQSAGKIKITQHEHFSDEPREVQGSAEYWTDGRESVNTVMGNKVTAHAKRDGDVLVIESRSNFNGTEIFLRDRWILSDSGAVLTLRRHFEGGGRTADQVIVFEKP